MDILIRTAIPEDLSAAVQVEEAAMHGGGYLNDTSEIFYNDYTGELMVAETEGKIIGVAKYTITYDGTAWLETLRVAPEYQRRGVGRRFYERFEEISHQKGVKSMAMYTGAKNIPSASLAREFGLDTAQFYREASLDLNGMSAPTAKTHPASVSSAAFTQVDGDRACQLLSSLEKESGGFLVLNRTFYHMGEPLYRALAQEGKVWEDKNSGSFMVLGNRFLPKRSLQIGIIGGDRQKCLDFAMAKALTLGRPQLIIMFAPENEKLQLLLEENGYRMASSDFQVMEGPPVPPKTACAFI